MSAREHRDWVYRQTRKHFWWGAALGALAATALCAKLFA